MINDLLSSTYVKGGRGPREFDCYGIVRAARQDLFGKRMLPAFDGVSPADKNSLTAACASVIEEYGFKRCDAREGAIATAWGATLCHHVGIVVIADGRVWILESDEKVGPCLTSINRFEKRFQKVIYYDD